MTVGGRGAALISLMLMASLLVGLTLYNNHFTSSIGSRHVFFLCPVLLVHGVRVCSACCAPGLPVLCPLAGSLSMV